MFTDIEIASCLTRFHDYLQEGIIQAMYDNSPDCCPYCTPQECDTYMSPSVRNYITRGGLTTDIHAFYTQKVAATFKDLLSKKQDIKSLCQNYIGPVVYPFFIMPVNTSCLYDKNRELQDFSQDLIDKDIMMPSGTPLIIMEYVVRKIHHTWFNVLEDVKWIPYCRWNRFGDFHERNVSLQASTYRLWDAATDRLVEQDETIVYQPPKALLEICA